jgi:hypothetical protein
MLESVEKEVSKVPGSIFSFNSVRGGENIKKKSEQIVYDPTPERKNNRKSVKREAAAPEKPKLTAISDEQFLEVLKQIDHPASSREVSDKLDLDPDKGRAFVRNRMKKLIKDGKVKAEQPAKDTKRKVKELYSLP